jgi:hypothetical protein
VDGGEWKERRFATKIVAVCACWLGAEGGFEHAAGGVSHRHKVIIHAINNHMLALIR